MTAPGNCYWLLTWHRREGRVGPDHGAVRPLPRTRIRQAPHLRRTHEESASVSRGRTHHVRGRLPHPRRSSVCVGAPGEAISQADVERRSRSVSRREVLDETARPLPCAAARHRPEGPRRGSDPAGRDRASVAGPRRLQRHPLPQGLHTARRRRPHRGVGGQRPGLPRRRLPAPDPRVDGHHRRPGRPPGQRVRRQHVPEGDGHLQHAAGPRRYQRDPRSRRQRQRRRLHGRRREDGRPGRQRPRRQLLRLPGRTDVHRGILLLPVQRAARPQRDDRRRLRLGAPDDGQPAGRADRRTCAPAVRRGRTSTRAPSPTSGSTCCTTTRTRSRRRGSTRVCPTSPRR